MKLESDFFLFGSHQVYQSVADFSLTDGGCRIGECLNDRCLFR